LIHRGAEYSRAIRRFTKKMGRYPVRLEDLENTNGLRFLRKRYKDPITGKDFKLLHLTDLQPLGIGGLGTNNATGANAGTQGNTAGDANADPPDAQAQQAQPTPDQLVQNQNSAFGAGQGAPTFAAGQNSSVTPNPTASFNGLNAQNAQNTGFGAQPFSSQQPISGGVIVGVASASKDQTIREFNKKNHYNDWLFFYDPAYDRGYEIKGPTQLTRPTANLSPSQTATPDPSKQ
jgi:hypothetical protein